MTNNIATKEEFETLTPEQKLQTDNEIRQEVFESLSSKNLQRIEEAAKKIALLPPESQEEIRNITWRTNKLRTVEEIGKFIKKNDRMPTALELAKEVGVSPPTIYKHLNAIREEGFSDEEIIFQSLKGKLMDVICTSALKGDVKSAKMCLDMIASSTKENVPTINNTMVSTAVEIVLQFVDPEKQNKAKAALFQLVEKNNTQSVKQI